MRIKNETHWNTQDLKPIILDAIRRSGATPAGYRIDLVYGRQTGRYKFSYTGYAYYDRKFIVLRLPPRTWTEDTYDERGFINGRTEPKENRFDPAAFARTLMHEIAHNQGVKHADMSESLLRCKGDYGNWANYYNVGGNSLPSQEEKRKSKYANACARIKVLSRKVKGLQTRIKHWERVKNSYERSQTPRHDAKVAAHPTLVGEKGASRDE